MKKSLIRLLLIVVLTKLTRTLMKKV